MMSKTNFNRKVPVEELFKLHNDLLFANGEDYSEDRLQQICIMLFRRVYPGLKFALVSVPNGGLRNAREAKLLKSTGTTPGVSDLMLIRKELVWLELKRFKKGSQSKVQKEFQDYVESMGYKYFLVRNLNEFWDVIIKYM